VIADHSASNKVRLAPGGTIDECGRAIQSLRTVSRRTLGWIVGVLRLYSLPALSVAVDLAATNYLESSR
jgi:hypothetical protein